MADINEIIKYDSDKMTQEEEIKFIQSLIDSGEAWTLQGHYGRTAAYFIDEGLCTKA